MKGPFQRPEDQPKPPATTPPGSATASGDRSIAIGGDLYGIASTGDNATFLPPEAFGPVTEVAAPPGLGNLPGRPGLFVGRTTALDRLDTALAGPGGVVVQAVHGLGGIGKSALAAHWADKSVR